MTMPINLVERTTPEGYKYLLARSANPLILASSDGCESCCDSCATVRKWSGCTLAPGESECTSAPATLYTCEPQPCPLGLKYANRCYTPTGIVIPIAQIPAGALLLSPGSFQCSGGCDAGCTQCPAYYKAIRCNGAVCPDNPTNLPIFVLASRVLPGICYGFDAANTIPGGCCYTVRVGRVYHNPPAGSIWTAGLTPNFRCCDCVPGCGHLIGPLALFCGGQTASLDCCCPNTFNFAVNARYDWQRLDVATNPIDGSKNTTTYQLIPPIALAGQGSVTNGGPPVWQGPNNVPPTQTGILRARATSTTPGVPVETVDYPYAAALGMSDACVPGFALIGIIFGGGLFGFPVFQTYCQTALDPSGSGVVVDNATSGRSCNQARVQNLWHKVITDPQAAGSTETGAFLSTSSISSTDAKCGDGCGGGTVKPIIIPEPPPLSPQPTPGGIIDPGVQGLLGVQMRLGGCQNCGDGFSG